ncbi:hypothetical protein C7413_1512 [Paraburkholderia silvatlantica]|nr:hypothetical protein C7411_1472 [Paraburkholderia silvatlantica]PXW23774.1 hypothetical protein C7413_1512 [Paraburkholderia silvatlantica]TDQ98944.1 hypothetical protein C7412_104161 [Paraburkholderia silvatlantica]
MPAKKTTPVEDQLGEDQLGKLRHIDACRVHNLSSFRREGQGYVFTAYFLPVVDLTKPVWEQVNGVDIFRGERVGGFGLKLNAGSLPCIAYNLVFAKAKQRAEIHLAAPASFTVDLSTQHYAPGTVIPASTFGPLYQLTQSELLKLKAEDSDGPIDLYIPTIEVPARITHHKFADRLGIRRGSFPVMPIEVDFHLMLGREAHQLTRFD